MAQRIDKQLRKISTEHGANYIPLLDYVCQAESYCRAYNRDHAIYFDDNHLSMDTARSVIANLILPALTQMVSPEGATHLR